MGWRVNRNFELSPRQIVCRRLNTGQSTVSARVGLSYDPQNLMKTSLFLKTFTALILSSFLVFSAGTAHAKRLTAAVADWTGGEITCQVAVSMLEQELGYRVDRIEFASGTGLWEAIAAGDIDFACESWPSYAEADDVMLNEPLYYDGAVVQEYSGTGEVMAFTTGIIGASDYYVPKYFVDANPDFRGWEDLNGKQCFGDSK
jgi:ABC-type proline/glycine betaine transport system substrate-binding protein